MAIAYVADRASANSNTGVTTVDLVLASLTVGNYLIIRSAADNSGGGGAARTFVVSNQSGTAMGAHTEYQQNNDPGAASAGTTCNVSVIKIAATSGTIRLTYGGSVVQACVAEEWTGIDDTTPVVGTPVGATASLNLPSCADTSVASGNLAYGAAAIEGPTADVYVQDADVTNGAWSTPTKLGTSNATATDNQTTYAGYKIVTAAGAQTWNATVGSLRDSAGIILELAAAPAPVLVVADAFHAHTADAAGPLTQHQLLAVADTAHALSADSVALTQHQALTVADSAHGHTADSTILVQHQVLALADMAHSHTTDPVTLTPHDPGGLVVADLAHAHTSDVAGQLVQHHTLGGLADVLHAHTADHLTLGASPPPVSLVVASMVHLHSADAVVLVVGYWLVTGQLRQRWHTGRTTLRWQTGPVRERWLASKPKVVP